MIADPVSFCSAEVLTTHPSLDVSDAEYCRLLGYPADHELSERARELMQNARAFLREHGQAFIYSRPVAIHLDATELSIEGEPFPSPQLLQYFRQANCRSAVLFAVSAGPALEAEARRRWEDAKPDEYFFLEVLGSALVEHLVAQLNARVCAEAERTGLQAVPHYSPGYTGWEIGEQKPLFELIQRGSTRSWPETLEVLPSGMLRPKKSLLGVIGVAPRPEPGRSTSPQTSVCSTCAYSPCGYRRAPYRHQRKTNPIARDLTVPVAGAAARYSVNLRALERWRNERVQLETATDGSVRARFRFDGTTCSNQGQPLAFDYVVELSSVTDGWRIRHARCQPMLGDEGYKSMCAYLTDPAALLDSIAAEAPLLGQPLEQVLAWKPAAAPSGCYCHAESRTHKWRLAFEAIHFALNHPSIRPASSSPAP